MNAPQRRRPDPNDHFDLPVHVSGWVCIDVDRLQGWISSERPWTDLVTEVGPGPHLIPDDVRWIADVESTQPIEGLLTVRLEIGQATYVGLARATPAKLWITARGEAVVTSRLTAEATG
ncbi:MAG: hypothetical protein ABW046_20655 [Actinoplanes sp.]